MSETLRIANHLSSLCVGFMDPRYTRGKLRTDPLYDGVYNELKASELPLLDIGCGMGILAMYLRERGWKNSVTGIDYDPEKINRGSAMISRGGYPKISISWGDARMHLPEHHGDVTILDILQFFDEEAINSLLKEACHRTAHDGKLVIRSGLKARNIRFLVTWLADVFAKCAFWMKAAPVHYPTAELFRSVLEGEGFSVEIRPFWGKTPFNNYLIVAKRE